MTGRTVSSMLARRGQSNSSATGLAGGLSTQPLLLSASLGNLVTESSYGWQAPSFTENAATETQRSPWRRSTWNDCVGPSARTRHSEGGATGEGLSSNGRSLVSRTVQVSPPSGD